MLSIRNNINSLVKALKENKAVNCNLKGNWFIERSLTRVIRQLFSTENTRWIVLSQAFVLALDALESVRIRFDGKVQEVDFKCYIAVGEIILEKMEKIASPAAFPLLSKLKQRLFALKYRLRAMNGGLDPMEVLQGDVFNELGKAASEWKHQQTVFLDKALTKRDVTRLQTLGRYGEFTEFILQDSVVREAVFNWVLRDRIAVAPLVEFPRMQEIHRQTHLHPQTTHRPHGTHLRPSHRGRRKRDHPLQIPFRT